MARARRRSAEIETDVLIVGGGMVGLTLAAALGSAGVRALVVDRADPAALTDPGFDGRTSAINCGSRRILEGIGVWRRLARSAEPILDIRISDGHAPVFLHFDHRQVGDEPMGHIVENRDLRRALFETAADLPTVTLRAPMTLAALERGRARVTAGLADGRRVAAALVVAADGRNSRLREDAGIRATRLSYPQTSIVCTVRRERPHRGIAHEHFLPEGPFAALPMRGDRSSIVWSVRSDLARALLALDRAAFDAELTRRFGGYLGRVEVEGDRWAYPLSLVHAQGYVAHRLALAGDAAHAIHPVAGQGLNLGVRDAAALAEVMVDACRLGLDFGDAMVLERYQRWRRFDAFTLIAVTDGLTRLFSNDVAPVRLARDAGLAAVNRIAPLKRFFMRHAMGLVGELPRLVRGEPL